MSDPTESLTAFPLEEGSVPHTKARSLTNTQAQLTLSVLYLFNGIRFRRINITNKESL